VGKDALLIIGGDDPSKPDALAIGPDGNLIVFDPETGAGAECCCGGGEPNPCCVDTQIVAFGQPFPTTCTTGLCTVCTGNWDRIEIHMSGTASVFAKNDDGSGSANFPIYRVNYTVSHGIFYEVVPVPEGDPDFPCKQRQGYVGANERHYVETLNNAPRFDYTTPRRIDYGQLAFGEEPGQDFTRGFSSATLTPLMWAAWGPDQLTGFAFDSIERKPNDTGTPGPYFGFLSPTNDLNGQLVKGASGNQFKNDGGGASRSMKWNAAHTCAGGSAHWESHQIGPTGGPAGKRSQNDVVVDLTWTYVLRECGASAQPSCEAFIAAWLAGDNAADINGDGFLTGDDFDLFMDTRPDCRTVVTPSQLSAINRLRRMNRPARAGAMTFSDLLRS